MSQQSRALNSASIEALVEQIPTLEPRLGDSVLVAVDGRSCSGKTTVAQTLAESLDATVVHLEYLYHGWDGLEAGVETAVTHVLEPLSLGKAATVPQWDWYAGGWGRPVEIAVPRLLILEGVGAASAAVRAHTSLAIWLEVPDDERRRRAQARDWDTFADHWDVWAVQETTLFAREGLPDLADLVLVGAG